MALTGFVLLWFLGDRMLPVARTLRAGEDLAKVPAVLDRAGGGLPVLTSDAHLYLEAFVRAPADRARTLVYTGEPDFTDTRGLRALSRWLPLRVEDLEPFLGSNRRFLLLRRDGNPWSEWLVPDLVRRGAKLALLADEGAEQLFAVTLSP